MSQGPSSGTQAQSGRAQPVRDPRGASPEQRHDDLEDRTQIWNLTAARIRIPNGQVIRPHSSARVAAWGVWKGDDVVKSWIETGALTETDPATQPPEVPGAQGGRSSVLSGTATVVGPVQSVFTGRVEGLQEPRLGPAGGQEAPGSQPPAPRNQPAPGGEPPAPGNQPAPGSEPTPTTRPTPGNEPVPGGARSAPTTQQSV